MLPNTHWPCTKQYQNRSDGLAFRRIRQRQQYVWLFHGTSTEAATLITRGDFLVDKAGSNAGTLYGRGIYLAESCSKSDEYSRENADGHRCILLCRATLGNILYNDEVSPNID